MLWKRHFQAALEKAQWKGLDGKALGKAHLPTALGNAQTQKEKCFGKDIMNQESEFGKSLEKDWRMQVSPS